MSTDSLDDRPNPQPADPPGLPPILEPPDPLDLLDEESDGFADEPRSVLITGAAGNLGRKLVAAWTNQYDLILVDRTVHPDLPNLIVADLTRYDATWVDLLEEVDTVIHLAANPDEFADWRGLVEPNLDAACNLFLATADAGVERLVFASSNHVMGGYRETEVAPIQTNLTPWPINAYGTTKLMGERLAEALTRTSQTTAVALRLGWILPGANRPENLPDDWARSLWLSNRDLVSLFECAVEAELEDAPFLVVNGLSRNTGSRWDITKTTETLGFDPVDDAFAPDSDPSDPSAP